jgi:hypothetical protein
MLLHHTQPEIKSFHKVVLNIKVLVMNHYENQEKEDDTVKICVIR